LSLLATLGDEPVMIGIDDVQWADPMSLGWLQFISRRLQAIPVHLVMTMRTTRGVESSAGGPLVLGPAMRRFVIHPLSLEATKSMIDGHFGLSCDASFIAAAHDLTDGSPRMLRGAHGPRRDRDSCSTSHPHRSRRAEIVEHRS
jgi:hypothetical protein